jgi:dipeptidyl aminopeptidase/acylaminoacyl peptidase
MPNDRRWSVLLVALLSIPGAEGALAQRSAEPLPLEVAVSLRGHNGRSPINLSPDGEWIAHTVMSDETVPRGTSRAFAETGFPFAEGDLRMEATISRTDGGEAIRLGAPDAASWGGVWSPDGRRVAFYSDEGGGAGLWLWERESGERRRVGSFVVRPFFGFEMPRWAADSRRLLVKLLPEGTTVAEANALMPTPQAEPPAPEVVEGEPSVEVRLSTAAEAARRAAGEDAAETATEAVGGREEYRRGLSADLALVDVESGQARRIVRDQAVRRYAFSPDDRSVAYSYLSGFVPDTQASLYELRLHDLASGEDRALAEDVPLSYGIEWSWSPAGGRIAYTSSGQAGEGDYVVVPVDPEGGGAPRALSNEAPHFSPGEGEVPPIWSADGSTLYGVGDGALWRVDPDSGEARELARVEGWELRSLVTSWFGSAVAWTTRAGEGSDGRLWLFAREEGGWRGAIVSVDPASGLDGGEARRELTEDRSFSHVFSQAAGPSGLFFLARDQRQPGEIVSYDPGSGTVRRVSRINETLDRFALGEARLLPYTSAHGEELSGTLLLPPGDPEGEPGRRLPLVVFVYAGEEGSRYVSRFGIWGDAPTFNMHVLASRGYAVLMPDAPVRPGRITEDLVATVLPAVDAAVEQGWADPERLAVMGQSFGALNVLALLTRTDRFGAAVITAAVQHPDLVADYLSGESSGYYEAGQGGMEGTPWEVPERYRENSPLFDFPEIETPILIGQGDQDGDLVPVHAIFAALERLGKQVELRTYRAESHVITRDANVIDFWQRRLEFLARHLDLETGPDGRVRPAG